jgi:hypothetical protein
MSEEYKQQQMLAAAGIACVQQALKAVEMSHGSAPWVSVT